MKKIYLSVMALAITAASTAQVHQFSATEEADFKLEKSDVTFKQTTPYINTEKASGDSIWSEDFAGGIGAWTTGGSEDIWAYDTDGPNGQYSSATEIIQSTTQANGFIIFDADANQTPTPGSGFFDHSGHITSPVIDFSGYTNLTLVFQHTYRTCCAQGFFPKVLVSDDNFATSTELNAEIPGTAVNAVPPTTITKLDLSSFIAGSTNLANVQVRFLFDGSGGTSHYWWQVDDIAVIESFENDLRLDTRFLASGPSKIPYHIVPTQQVVDVELSGEITNLGVNTQNETQLEVVIDDGTTQNTFSSPAGFALAPGTKDSLVATTWTPSGAAGTTYDMLFRAVQTENEQEDSDNFITDTYTITDSTYGVDNDVRTGSFTNFSSNVGLPVKIGNQMEIMADGQISSLSFYVNDVAASTGQAVSGQLHILDQTANPAVFLYEDETNFHSLTASDLGSFVTVTFANPIQVTAGDIILPLASHDGLDVSFGMAQRVEQGIVVGQLNDGSYASLTDPNAVMIRVNMNPEASIDSEDASAMQLTQYPNPFSDETTVEYTLENASEVSYTLVDLTGKTILDVNEGNVMAGTHEITIDGANLANGVYYFNMNAGGAQTTHKMIVNK